jgi:hypothetical protein
MYKSTCDEYNHHMDQCPSQLLRHMLACSNKVTSDPLFNCVSADGASDGAVWRWSGKAFCCSPHTRLAGSITAPPPEFEAKRPSSSPPHNQRRGPTCLCHHKHQNMCIVFPAQVCGSYSSVAAASMPLSAFATSACMQLSRPEKQHRPSGQWLHRHHQQLLHGFGPARCPNMPAAATYANDLHRPKQQEARCVKGDCSSSKSVSACHSMCMSFTHATAAAVGCGVYTSSVTIRCSGLLPWPGIAPCISGGQPPSLIYPNTHWPASFPPCTQQIPADSLDHNS